MKCQLVAIALLALLVFARAEEPKAAAAAAGDHHEEEGDAEAPLSLERKGTPSTGPCPQGCKCFANEEACQVFVDCHAAGLKEVPAAASIDPNADCIDLSQNELRARPGMFSAFPAKLNYLELHGNKLGEDTVPGNLFSSFSELVHLGIEQNGLKTLPSDFLAGLGKLKVIYLSHNELASLPENLFASTPDLRVVLLQHNKLEAVPEHLFTNLKALKVIKLVDNKWAETANANGTHFAGLNLFQLDLKDDTGDFYEDAMLEGLPKMSELGAKEPDAEAVRKLQEQNRLDDDLFSLDAEMAGEAEQGGDNDADALEDEHGAADDGDDATGGDADGDATHTADGGEEKKTKEL